MRKYVQQNIGRISGVTLREAVKYLSAGDREALMETYRNR